MEQSEFNTHSFVVKVWLEETVEESGQARWRGHITHVQSGQREYFENLDRITDFIAPYLTSMGARLGIYQHVKQWMRRWKRSVVGR